MARKLGGKKRTGINPLAYLGVEPTSPANFLRVTRAPTLTDTSHNIGTVWLHEKNDSSEINDIYTLVDINTALSATTTPQGPAQWIQIAAGSGDLSSLTGDAGGPVFGDISSNIDIHGGDLITITGTPASNLLSVGLDNGLDGEVIIGSTAGSPAYATLKAGSGITIANASNSITINSTGTMVWAEVFVSQPMGPDRGYITNAAGLVTLTLPGTAAIGDKLHITGKGVGGWLIAQNAGQTIYFGVGSTTTGVGGSVSSTQTRDSIELVCVTANNDFNVLSSIGNITVV